MFDVLIRELAARFNLGAQAEPVLRMVLADMVDASKGGLPAFVQKFEAAGLGARVASWVGEGAAAQSISPAQVETVLGGSGDLISRLSKLPGLTRPDVTVALTYLLPALVGKLTPDGTVGTVLPVGFKTYFDASAARVSASNTSNSAADGLVRWLPWLFAALAGLSVLAYCSKQQSEPVAPEFSAMQSAPMVAAASSNPASATAAAPTVAASSAASAPAANNTASAAGSSAPSAAAAPAASVVADQVDGKPRVTVYFDVSKADVAADFATVSADLRKAMTDNTALKAQLAGFNDPTGNAASNALLAKKRAQAVRTALLAAGIAPARIELVKPAAPIAGAPVDNAAARRVEITLH